jgi:hypothetical protein
MLVKKHLMDFYTVKLKKPIHDKNFYVTITITVEQPLLLSVEPSTITLDANQHHATVKVTSLSADSYFSNDQQFSLTHTTSSCDLEMHRLALKLNCYQLSQISKELIGAGCDDHF